MEVFESTTSMKPGQARRQSGISSPDSSPSEGRLPFVGEGLLAPMEGVTDVAYRGVVTGLHSPCHLGGAFTEFVRVVDVPLPSRFLLTHLADRGGAIPVGIQLMGSDLDAMGETARRAVEVGAPLIDLNFGCPAKGALRGCAGSAVLLEPDRLEKTIRSVVTAVAGNVPVTAKIRAGYDDDALLVDLCHAVEEGGAELLTLHCRTRREAYQASVDWRRIARAVDSVSIPVCGNGGVAAPSDIRRMRRETGCRFVMIGHGALADPWIFSGYRATRAEGARFLLDYASAMRRNGASLGGRVARIKQLLRVYRAGGLFRSESERRTELRQRDPAATIAWLEQVARTE